MKYLYNLGTRPLAQNATAWEYLLPDALGSVRQIADANGNITLAESYEPYGTVLTSIGTASSIFAYAGEQIDTTGLIYLRARYMNPRLGIFLAHDPWSGDEMRPGSMNGFGYAEGNPVNQTDPSGRSVRWPWSCMWPNHQEEVYVWLDGHPVLEIRCVGPNGLPPVVGGIGNTTTIGAGDPTSAGIKMLIVYGAYCIIQLVNTWPGARAIEKAKPFEEPVSTPTPFPPPPQPPEPDFIWRGIDGPVAKSRDFKPRFPRDADGLSFFEGRANMWGATLMVPNPEARKPFRAGFTYSALTTKGFSVDPDDVPPGHRSIKRSSRQQWQEWLYANNPQHPYQQSLAGMAVIVEPNTAP